MKTTLTFEFDEENAHDQELFRRLTHANQMAGALYNIQKHFASQVDDDDLVRLPAFNIVKIINAYLEQYGVDLEELYT